MTLKLAGLPRKVGRLAAACLAAALLLPPTQGAAGETALGSGVNILGYDGIWDGGTNAPFRGRYFPMLREAGFRHVRINLYAFRHMDSRNRLDPAVAKALDWVLEQSIAAGLIPVIDEHDFELCQSDPDTCATKLDAFWREISDRYAGRYPQAVFEILNEPGGAMTMDAWNAVVANVIGLIRERSPERTIVVAALNTDGPIEARVPHLPESDRNLVVTVHYYRPMVFTHQGAPWAPEFRSASPVDWGSAADKRQVTADFERVAQWAEKAGRPVYLGEFGVYDKAPPPARARYAAFLARTAERLGWSWAFWQFDHDFALFDMDTRRWNEPLLRALLPRG